MKNKIILLPLLFFYFNISAQLQFFSPDAMNGYTLFLGNKLNLVNNCGELINQWNEVIPKYHVKLLPNGNIIYIDWNTNSITQRDWDDNFVSQTFPTDNDITLDYEVIVLENGNYLCVARKDFSTADFLAIGYNTDDIGSPYHVDVVVEIDSDSGETVWLWNIADHVIQERADTIPNYGLIIDHPELLNLDAISTIDWQVEESWMVNGMDYNVDLDQIALSVRKMGEVIIIDHSTTTAEAATHAGGTSGKGGDILYRWGNPENYNRGTSADRELYFQHNPNWIEYGEHIGKIAIYNNGLFRPGISFANRYSNAPIIETPILPDGNYEIGSNMAFEPSEPNVDYGGLPSSLLHFYSNYTSANKVLPNENVLITIGDDNRVIELKPDGTLVWEYRLATAFFTFRAEKYPLDYPAFDGKDLTPMGIIGNPSITVPCELASSTEVVLEDKFNAWVDGKSRNLIIEVENGGDYNFALYDLLGKKMQSFDSVESENGKFQLQLLPNLKGILFLTLIDEKTGSQKSAKLFLP